MLKASGLVGAQEAQDLVKSGKFTFIDVRPKKRFEDSHIPDAVSVPLYQKVVT